MSNLKNIECYSEYKKYRFINESSQRLDFSNFDDDYISNLEKFDTELKTLFYPKIMFIENELKNYIVDSILKYSEFADLEIIFAKYVTDYKSYTGTKDYKKNYTKRLRLKNKITESLIKNYENNNKSINYFFNNDLSMPIWIVVEVLTLGELGNLFSCLDKEIKKHISKLLNIPSNFDNDGKFIEYSIYTIKDLRNAVAHNNVIFDARFKSLKINKRIKEIFQYEMKISIIDFNYIYEYVILIAYILHKFNQPGEKLIDFLNNFVKSVDIIKNFPQNIHDKILGTNMKSSIKTLKRFIEKH